MANAWDYFMKRLIGGYPKQFTNWLLAGATFIRPLDNELKIQSLYADALLEVVVHGKPALLHVEFQTYDDPDMGIRILEYNILASRQYDRLPTYSIVIYLRKDGEVAESPYRRIFPDDRPIHNFHFQVIKLWEIQAEMIFQTNLTGLLPLVTLTENGKQPEVVQTMIDRLANEQDRDLLAIASIVGGLVFKKADEQAWFKRRFIMFQDILRDSWVYQQIGEDFFKDGIKQERQQELHRFRQMVTEVAQMRFASLVALAKQKAEILEDPDALHQLTIQLIGAQDTDEARELLLQVSKLEEQN
jgi:hypothetical protein